MRFGRRIKVRNFSSKLLGLVPCGQYCLTAA